MLCQDFSRKLLLFAATLFAAQMIAETPKIRIMPLGDSITDGTPTAGGYRLPLYAALTNAGYNVGLVGTQSGNSAPGLGIEYTLIMNNLADLTQPGTLTIAADTQLTFVGVTPRGAENHVSEFNDYSLIYSLEIPDAVIYKDVAVDYSVDRSALIPDGSFSRIAYYLELQKTGEGLQYLWVSMDAFTAQAVMTGVPAPITGAVYQQYVNNMNIFCNVPGVTTGSSIPGNIEFWPFNYNAANAVGIPGATDNLFDCGDIIARTGFYGSMQIHNYDASQTLMAFNKWGSGGVDVDLGIGNDPNTTRDRYNPDWTYAGH